jgi:hypothetical protein
MEPATVPEAACGPPGNASDGSAQAVHEHRQPLGGARERRRKRRGSQVNITPAGPHAHPDGERGHAGPEPIAGHRVEPGKGQVPRRRAGHTAHRSAAGANPLRNFTAHHARHHAATPDGKVDTPGDGVVDDPHRGARHPSWPKTRPAMARWTRSIRLAMPATAHPPSRPAARSSAGVTGHLPKPATHTPTITTAVLA